MREEILQAFLTLPYCKLSDLSQMFWKSFYKQQFAVILAHSPNQTDAAESGL